MLDFSSRFIAHRGASSVAPENTLSALRFAHALNATWVECDVMLTADEVPVIVHDARLERTTNGKGYVRNTHQSVLSEYDAGSWFSSEFHDERVPTLQSWLDCAESLNVRLNLELKPLPGDEQLLAERVVSALKKMSYPRGSLPLLSSFSENCLSAVQGLMPECPRSLLLEEWSAHWYVSANRLDCLAVALDHRALSAERVALIKASGYYTLAYTVDEIEVAESLFAMGVDAIFTNDMSLQSL